jgi:hypothetical protein
MYVGLHVKYPLFFQIFMKLEFSLKIFEKYSNVKFHENPPIGSRVVPCGPTDRHEEDFRYFAKAPEKRFVNIHYDANTQNIVLRTKRRLSADYTGAL